MSTTIESPTGYRRDELARLFYSFRMAHLNRRYYSERASGLRRWDKIFQVIISVATAASFAVLAFADFEDVKFVAAAFAVIAFLASIAVPIFGLNRKIDEASARASAFHYAAQQLESALRFVKNSDGSDGEVAGWVHSAEEAYHQAAALPDTDSEDRELVKKLEDEINKSFPPNYVWTAY
jgi:hypothetical protein